MIINKKGYQLHEKITDEYLNNFILIEQYNITNYEILNNNNLDNNWNFINNLIEKVFFLF